MSGNIKVVVRCRPLNSKEISRNATHLVRMEGNQTILTKPKSKKTAPSNAILPQKTSKPHQTIIDDGNSAATTIKAFTFDRSYWSADKCDPFYADQEQVYNDIGGDLLDHAFDGYNCCIFAYGQTGSGKSYTMMGYGEEKGIIPRTCVELFERIAHLTTESLKFQVEVSYLEIYNEKVRDLLNPGNKGNLKVREHPTIGPYVEDLSRLLVNSYEDMEHLMNEGNKARTVAATNMNETSSRSHAVFTIFLTSVNQQEKSVTSDSSQRKGKVSRISLVDLAGSERANSTGATGIRLKEGANINKSLATLGKVIAALADQSSNTATAGAINTMMKRRSSLTAGGNSSSTTNNAIAFIPYRDSVLTWLLKDSLGGNSKTTMIATISPTDYEETLSTLRYADQAKHIKNKPVVNEDPNARLIRELKEELQALRDTLMVYAPAEVEKIAQKQKKRASSAASSRSTATTRSALSPTPAMSRESSASPMLLVSPESPVATSALKKRNSMSITSNVAAHGNIISKEELLEQLETSEKLLASVNQTWEEKMKQTEAIHREREKALEELGVIVEKDNMGIYAPKTVHLINLNEDPLMTECLMYQIKPGITRVGRLGSQVPADIRLSGSEILDDHCYFENIAMATTTTATDDSSGTVIDTNSSTRTVTIYPNKQAVTLVNGMRIYEPRELHSGYRIIFGSGLHHLFRFNNPGEVKRERDQQQPLVQKGLNNERYQQQYQQEGATSLFLSSYDIKSDSGSTESAVHMAGSPTTTTITSLSAAGDHYQFPCSPLQPEIIDWNFAHNEALRHFGSQGNADLTKMTDEDLKQLSEGITRIRESRNRHRISSDNNSLYSDSIYSSNNIMPRASISSATSCYSNNSNSSSVVAKFSTPPSILGNMMFTNPFDATDIKQEQDKQTASGRLSVLSVFTQDEKDELIRTATEEMQQKLDHQKQEYEEKIKWIESSNMKASESDKEKAILATKYALMKQQMERSLEEQKEVYESKIKRISANLPPGTQLSSDNLIVGFNAKNAPETLQRWAVDKWRQLRYFKMAEDCLVHAVLLKEANVMARELKKEVIYQFTVVHDDLSAHSRSFWESTAAAGNYNSSRLTSSEQPSTTTNNHSHSDSHLLKDQKPCLAVQVIDKLHHTTYIWSIIKLKQRLKQMRKLYDYADDNNRSLLTQQHFNREDPFHELVCPRYTLIGLARVPSQNLTLQLHADNSVDIYCRNTGRVMGQVRVMITPIARSISKKQANTTMNMAFQAETHNKQQQQSSSVNQNNTKSPPSSHMLKRGFLKQRALSEKYLLHTGQQQVFEVRIEELKGINESDFTQVHAQFRLSSFGNVERFSTADKIYQTEPVSGFGNNGRVEFGQCQTLSIHITNDMMDVILNQGLTVEVYGRMQEPYLYKLIEEASCSFTGTSTTSDYVYNAGLRDYSYEDEESESHQYVEEPAELQVATNNQKTTPPLVRAAIITLKDDDSSNSQRQEKKSKRFPFKRTFSTEQQTYNGILMRERHDVLAWIQITELDSNGEYSPVRALYCANHHTNKNQRYVFCLRQGLQRRISITLKHDSGTQLNWHGIEQVTLGNVRLVNHDTPNQPNSNDSEEEEELGAAMDKSEEEGSEKAAQTVLKKEDNASTDININLLPNKTKVLLNPNGTSTVTVEGAWDSSLHDSIHLNRITPTGHYVCMALYWKVRHDSCSELLCFKTDIMLQMDAREKSLMSSISSSSLFRQFLLATGTSAGGIGGGGSLGNDAHGNATKIVDKASLLFTIELKPRIAKHAKDLWRLDTGKKYVRGEEFMGAWHPKGVSLINDYRRARQRMLLREDVALFRQSLNLRDHPQAKMIQHSYSRASSSSDASTSTSLNYRKQQPGQQAQRHTSELLMKVIDLWKRKFGEQEEIILSQDPPSTNARKRSTSVNSVKSSKSEEWSKLKLIAHIRQLYPSDTVTKRGYLLQSDKMNNTWNKHWFVLRRPYLIIYKDQSETEELSVLNLIEANVNYKPDMIRLLQRKFAFEVYTANNAYLFQASSFDDMKDWLSKIDQFYPIDNLKEPSA